MWSGYRIDTALLIGCHTYEFNILYSSKLIFWKNFIVETENDLKRDWNAMKLKNKFVSGAKKNHTNYAFDVNVEQQTNVIKYGIIHTTFTFKMWFYTSQCNWIFRQKHDNITYHHQNTQPFIWCEIRTLQ